MEKFESLSELEKICSSKEIKYFRRMMKKETYYNKLLFLYITCQVAGMAFICLALYLRLDSDYIIGGMIYVFIGVLGVVDLLNNKNAFRIITKLLRQG